MGNHQVSLVLRSALRLAALIALVGAMEPAASAQGITCTRTDGLPGDETTVTINILDPLDGSIIPATAACGQPLSVTGTWSIDAPPPLYDFYIVIDASGSTATDSGSDVDGDGIRFEYDDNIYCAEIAAAKAFIDALDPASARVSVTRFQSFAELSQPLTTDFAAAQATLDRMKTVFPGGGTAYVPAMRSMEAEVVASGDRVNRDQVCLFLSDGQPNESLAATDAEAANVAALPVVMHTFALGFPSSTALENMAAITGGIFTPLTNPGDIVALLPSFIPVTPHTLNSLNTASGERADGTTDDTTGTFSATVMIFPGSNHIIMTLAATGRTPVTVDCEINVDVPKGFAAVVGPLSALCENQMFTLDGSGSDVRNCPQPLYRWLDCNGMEIAPPSPFPTFDVASCASCGDFTLEVSCQGELCVTTASAAMLCNKLPTNAPSATPGCGPTANLACGGDLANSNWWDFDLAVDADSDGDPGNDQDALGCDLPITFPTGGSYRISAIVRDDATGCMGRSELAISVPDGVTPRNIDGGLCPNVIANFSCGTADPASTYWWDFDGAVDSDSNGDSTDDRDASGCDVSTSWPVDGSRIMSGWQLDANGCTWLIAQGTMDISGGAIPGETPDLRVVKSADSVVMSWGSVPGAPSHRVLRGSIDSLWVLRLYDHAADDAAGQGACDTVGARVFTDPDDAVDDIGYYYLITALNPCGGEGITGFGWDGTQPTARPVRLTTGSCP